MNQVTDKNIVNLLRAQEVLDSESSINYLVTMATFDRAIKLVISSLPKKMLN